MPTDLDSFLYETGNDEKFSKIPDDLINEYLDLQQQKSQQERQYQMALAHLMEEHKKKKKLILLNLDANYKKMVEMSGLDSFHLSKRLPPTREEQAEADYVECFIDWSDPKLKLS